MAQQYDFISSDTHLEVLPERWTGRVPAQYRDKMPRTVTHPDGGDAIQIEGAPLFQVAYLDLRAGRTAEDWQPFGVRVEETAGVGSAEQRLQDAGRRALADGDAPGDRDDVGHLRCPAAEERVADAVQVLAGCDVQVQ